MDEMLTNTSIWQKIFQEDILYNNHEMALAKHLDLKSAFRYFAENQSKNGYFHKESPVIYDTFYFSGILKCVGRMPSKNTIEYTKSLQVGSIGFSETTGETPWTDKSYMAIQMFDWFDIPIQKKNEMATFFQNFQNPDGGFGSLSCENSNFRNTVETIFILNKLDSKPRFAGQAAQWLTKNTEVKNPWELCHLLQSLKLLNHSLNKEEKNTFDGFILNFLNRKNLDNESKYYCIKSLSILGISIAQYKDLMKNSHSISNNAKENYYLCELLSIYNEIKNNIDEFYPYVKRHELPQGGFSSSEVSIIKNCFMAHSLYLMGLLGQINKDKFAEWLLSVAGNEGWGPIPSSQQYHEYTVAALIALKLCGKTEIENKDAIINVAKLEMSNAINFKNVNNYHVLRTIKNSLEMFMLLDIKPENLLRAANKVMEYYNEEGGFGPKHKPYLYATFWAVRSLYLIEKYLNYSKKIFISKLGRVREKTASWINSCQNQDGGFGPMPNQPSNIQSTFCAIYSLWMLDNLPKDKENAIAWILSLQKPDGGFAGHINMESEMLHILYAIGSLATLAN